MTDSAPTTPDSLDQALKRCRPEVITAAKSYRAAKDPSLLPAIVLGVFERFMEPERRSLISTGLASSHRELRIMADLGLDSLTMVEVVMTLEEVLGERIPDEELRGLVTLGDTLDYVAAKGSGGALPELPERIFTEAVPMLLGSEDVAVYGVVLRKASAQSLLNPTLPADVANVNKAFLELANIWRQKKSSLLAPEAARVTFQAGATTTLPTLGEGKSLQLEIVPTDTTDKTFNAFVWATGGERLAWGKVVAL